jgi:hypothetical protein
VGYMRKKEGSRTIDGQPEGIYILPSRFDLHVEPGLILKNKTWKIDNLVEAEYQNIFASSVRIEIKRTSNSLVMDGDHNE